MKNKIITIILGLLLVVSAVINVWQYNNNNSLKVQTELLQNELDSIEENINSLNMDISAKNEEITTLTSKIADLETEIATLTVETELSEEDIEAAKEEGAVFVEPETTPEETAPAEVPAETPTPDSGSTTDDVPEVGEKTCDGLEHMGSGPISEVISDEEMDALLGF